MKPDEDDQPREGQHCSLSWLCGVSTESFAVMLEELEQATFAVLAHILTRVVPIAASDRRRIV